MKEGMKAAWHRHIRPDNSRDGLHCPCCNPYGCTVRKMKKRAHRKIRRGEKQRLRLEQE